MSDLMKVSSNPHIRSKATTDRIMLTVIIALLPASIFGIWNFGIRAALIIAVTVASTVLTLLLLPTFYLILDGVGRKRREKKKIGEESQNP